jgi:hypothetical protein
MAQLERNDVDGALARARKELEETGKLSPETGEVLWMLQDDPAEFVRRLNDLYDERGIPYE